MFNFGNNKTSAFDVADIRRMTIKTLRPVINEYADWYAEHGITLPEEFAQDPTTWTNHLRTIQRAFNLAGDELEGKGEIFTAFKNNRDDLVATFNKEKQDGFELFGKYLSELVDPRYE